VLSSGYYFNIVFNIDYLILVKSLTKFK